MAAAPWLSALLHGWRGSLAWPTESWQRVLLKQPGVPLAYVDRIGLLRLAPAVWHWAHTGALL